MKKLIILSLALFSTQLWAQCNNKINESKVMVFVDTNESELEIATAQKAACQRGQKLMIIPKNYKEYDKNLKNYTDAAKSMEACFQKNKNSDKACLKETENYRAASSSIENFRNSQPKYKDQLKTLMEELKSKKATLENFTISGHDGGGRFGGSKQSIKKEEVAEVMKDYPEVNNVRSLMLLGCYTGVPKEVIDWQFIFPEVRLIGGYDGSAPLASRPQGHSYYLDLLTKEPSLTKDADQKKLQSLISNNIKGLNDLNAAMLFKPECSKPDDEKTFYYGAVGKSKELRPFNVGECIKMKPELLVLRDRLNLYRSGELNSPVETSSGELRNIYNKARASEHCSEYIGPILNANEALNLLFFHGFRDNFAEYYDEDMKKVEEMIKSESQETMINKLSEDLKQNNIIYGEKLNEIQLIENNPEAYQKRLETKLDEELQKYRDSIKDPKYKSLLEKMPVLKLDKLEWSDAEIPQLTTQEQELMFQLTARQSPILNLKEEIQFFEKEPKNAIEARKSELDFFKSRAALQKSQLDQVKKSNPLSKIWIPTKKNLEGKTRKEILENLHEMHSALMMDVISQKNTSALAWVQMTTTNRLQYFQTPFTWHEYKAGQKPETPEFDSKLEDSLNPRYGNGNGGVVGGGNSGINTSGDVGY